MLSKQCAFVRKVELLICLSKTNALSTRFCLLDLKSHSIASSDNSIVNADSGVDSTSRSSSVPCRV